MAFVLLACGGETGYDSPAGQAMGGGSNVAGAGGTPSTGVGGGVGGTSTGGQVYSTYTAEGCPDASAPSIEVGCDLFAMNSGCPDGYGCFPLVRSSNNPCQPAEYYFRCLVSGSAMQSDNCDQTQRCAAGYVCVVTNIGTKCQQVCDTSDPGSCLPGMFCDPIDVPGVGTCS